MQFRKNPVTIEARQVGGDYEGDLEVLAWCGGRLRHPDEIEPDELFVIDTLEGAMIARSGDWIIQGVQGEFYPCKPEIFVETYVPADWPVRVPVGQAVVFTQDDTDAVRVTVEPHIVKRRVPRIGGEGFELTPRSAQLVSLNAQQWVHAEDGEVV